MKTYACLRPDYQNTLREVLDRFPALKRAITAVLNQNEHKRNSVKWLLYVEQCLINLPILYLASLYLYAFAKKHGYTNYLFCTRDCCHWHRIFTRLFPDERCHYFHCSRNMFNKAKSK